MNYLLIISNDEKKFDVYIDRNFDHKMVLDYMEVRMLLSDNSLKEVATTKAKYLLQANKSVFIDFSDSSVTELNRYSTRAGV